MGRPHWTEKEIKLLFKLYPKTETKKLEKVFKRTATAISQKAQALKLHKDPEFKKQMLQESIKRLQDSGKANRFKKGNRPWNDGLAGKGIFKPNVGSFKKGNMPHTTRPVGSQRLDKEGYIIEKQEDGRWIRLQVKEWEKHYGKIPPKHYLRLKVKDKTCTDINQMFVVSFKENIELNSINRYPSELRKIIITLAKFKKKIRNEKQD